MWSVNYGGDSHRTACTRQSDEDGSQHVSEKMFIWGPNPSGCFCVVQLWWRCGVHTPGLLVRCCSFNSSTCLGSRSVQEKVAHQKALAFALTGRASTETLSPVEISNCSRQWSGILPEQAETTCRLCGAFTAGLAHNLCPHPPTKE